MYERPSLDLTLSALKDKVHDRSEMTVLPNTQISIDLTSDSPSLRLAEIEVPATVTGIAAMGSFFGVPTAFLDKIASDEQEWIIGKRIERTPTSEVAVYYTDEGVTGVYSAGQKTINPSRIVSVAQRVVGEDASVIDLVHTPDDFIFDVVAPRDLGDPKSLVVDTQGNRVGDITRGGVRFGYDRKRNLSPYAQQFFWRLACTNGMEVFTEGSKVDARGAESVDDVLRELEAVAELAFSMVENSVNAFYDLRNQRIQQNPDRMLRRLARENRVPTRTVDNLLDRAYEIDDEGTMFDLVNLMTNEANAPAMRRFGPRHVLQRAGGAVINDHAQRCPHCLSRTGH